MTEEPSAMIERSSSPSADTLTSPATGIDAVAQSSVAADAAGQSHPRNSEQELLRRRHADLTNKLNLHVNEFWSQRVQQQHEREGRGDTRQDVVREASSAQVLARERARLWRLKESTERKKEKEKQCRDGIANLLQEVNDPEERSGILQDGLQTIQRWSEDESGAESWYKNAIPLYKEAIRRQKAGIEAFQRSSSREMRRKRRAEGLAENSAPPRPEVAACALNAPKDEQVHPGGDGAPRNQTLMSPTNFVGVSASGQCGQGYAGGDSGIAGHLLSMQRIQSSPGMMFGRSEHGLAGGSPRAVPQIQRYQSSATLLGRNEHGHATVDSVWLPRTASEQSGLNHAPGDTTSALLFSGSGHLSRPLSVGEYRHRFATAWGRGGRGPPARGTVEDRTITTGHISGDNALEAPLAGTVTTSQAPQAEKRPTRSRRRKADSVADDRTDAGAAYPETASPYGKTPEKFRAMRSTASGGRGVHRHARIQRQAAPAAPKFGLPGRTIVTGQSEYIDGGERRAAQSHEQYNIPVVAPFTRQEKGGGDGERQAEPVGERLLIPGRVVVTGQGQRSEETAAAGAAAGAGVGNPPGHSTKRSGQQHLEDDSDWIAFCNELAKTPLSKRGYDL